MKHTCTLALALLAMQLLPLHAQVGATKQEAETKDAPNFITDKDKAGHSNLRQPFLILIQGSVRQSTLVVKLSEITSVSTHIFYLDKNTPIHELVIDTTGNSSIRLYARYDSTGRTATNAQALLDRIQARAVQRAGAPTTAAKSYPETTHAHTIEYALQNSDQIEYLLQVITRAWVNNRGVKVKI